jgi:hypothetical protein
MKILRIYRRLIAIPTAAMMVFLMLPYGAAQAAMISTEQAVAAPASTRTAAEARAYVMGIVQRADVQAEMRALGVDPAEAVERVKAMSDSEIKQAAGRIDASPAGAGGGTGIILGIVGAVVFVFIVLLITDILCLTSVFDFTKCSVKGKKK